MNNKSCAKCQRLDFMIGFYCCNSRTALRNRKQEFELRIVNYAEICCSGYSIYVPLCGKYKVKVVGAERGRKVSSAIATTNCLVYTDTDRLACLITNKIRSKAVIMMGLDKFVGYVL